jgi:nitrogen fixation/metabolism regulation signal transduction histidine kinase
MLSRVLRYGLFAALALGGVLLFLLASASGNTAFFERHYPLLLQINAALAVVLAALVTWLVVRLWRRHRRGEFGSRLLARFALAFALLGVVPGALVYLVSVQFLGRSIESWFDVRVERALDSGLAVGRAVLDNLKAEVSSKARQMATELADTPPAARAAALNRLREQAGIAEALLLSGSGQLIAASATQLIELVPDLPSAAQLRTARGQRIYASIEGEGGAAEPHSGLRVRVLVPLPLPTPSAAASSGLLALEPLGRGLRESGRESGERRGLPMGSGADQVLLQVIQPVPASIAANAEALTSGYREYQELSLARSGLARIYTVTLTLTLLLAIFGAVAVAVLLSSSMTAPLLQLAEGTRKVAEGDYRPVQEFRGNDELNLLTQSFNAMTRQLTDARDAVESRSRELEHAKAFLERVLANLSAGVLVLDQHLRLVSANYGAARILGAPVAERRGEPLAALEPALAAAVEAAAAEPAAAGLAQDVWQQQVEIKRSPDPLLLLVRGSRLPLDDGPGTVLVFDDITQVISAQRALAWGEVARRLAHEIKNPLTPIQLAAERLEMKLADRLQPADADVLRRGSSTIVNQVAAMKRMVDDFRDYARVPPARLAPLDLNALVAEVAALYGHGSPQLGLELAPGLPHIEGDATQLRQVIHNLLSNASEAMAGRPGARVRVTTSAITRTEDGSVRAVRFRVEDNGPGFAANILRRAFEPYVTTKPSGTGLGLAMVKKIVDEHGARIELANLAPEQGVGGAGGAAVNIVFRRLAAAAPDNRDESRS